MVFCQIIVVDNASKRPFRNEHFATSHTPESAQSKQQQRKRLGSDFVNGWYIVRRADWTEYQRFYNGRFPIIGPAATGTKKEKR